MTRDTFTQAYIEAALWSSMDDDGTPLDEAYTIDDIAPDTLAAMARDCAQFQAANAGLLALAGDDTQNGHDYWLTRNRHGAGFWDRGYDEAVSKPLTDAAHADGESNLYVGDDGLLYL
jgi:hypothetical protein